MRDKMKRYLPVATSEKGGAGPATTAQPTTSPSWSALVTRRRLLLALLVAVPAYFALIEASARLRSKQPWRGPHFNEYHQERLSPVLRARLDPIDTDRLVLLQPNEVAITDEDWNFTEQMKEKAWSDVRRPPQWMPRGADWLLPRRRTQWRALSERTSARWWSARHRDSHSAEIRDAWKVPMKVVPKEAVLPTHAPARDKLMFGMVTTVERALDLMRYWVDWLAPDEDGKQPMCLILLAPSEKESDIAKLHKALKDKRIACGTRQSKEPRYELRVLSMTHQMGRYVRSLPGNKEADWYIWGDDDTTWLSLTPVQRMLSLYDPSVPHFVGAHSDSLVQHEIFSTIALGGAGMFTTRALYKQLEENSQLCLDKFGGEFGGDGMMSSCVGWVMGKDRTKIVEVQPGLHQWDVPGDVSGVLQAGLPMLNLHHYLALTWVHLLGFGHPLSASWPLSPDSDYSMAPAQIALINRVYRFLGGDNFLRRYVFDQGHTVFTLGYTITLYTVPMKEEDLMGRIEHTWHHFYPVVWQERDVRFERWGIPGWGTEGADEEQIKHLGTKQTFMIEDIEVFHERAALMTYIEVLRADEHHHPSGVPKLEDRVRIRVLWDGCWNKRVSRGAGVALKGNHDACNPLVESGAMGRAVEKLMGEKVKVGREEEHLWQAPVLDA